MTLKEYLERNETGKEVSPRDSRVAAGVFHKSMWPLIVEWAAKNNLQWDEASSGSSTTDLKLQDNRYMFETGDWNAIFYLKTRKTLYRAGTGQKTPKLAVSAAAEMLGPPLDMSKLIQRPQPPLMEF